MEGMIGREVTTDRIREWLGLFMGAFAEGPHSGHNVIIGYNTLPLASELADETARIVAESGVPVYLTTQPTPWPAVRYLTKHKKLAGAIYLGGERMRRGCIRISALDWGLRPLESTERRFLDHMREPAEVSPIDPRPAYFLALEDALDMTVFGADDSRIILDALHGSTSEFVDAFLRRAGVQGDRGFTANYEPTPHLSGTPTVAEDVSTLKEIMLAEGAQIGLQFGIDGTSAIGVHGEAVYGLDAMSHEMYIMDDLSHDLSINDPILISLAWYAAIAQQQITSDSELDI